MKKIVFGLLALGLLVPSLAFAADLRTGKTQSLASGDVVADDLYLFGGNLIDAGTVHGDLIAAGGTILVTGAVDGALQVAGGNLALTGAVGQSVRAAGGTVLITSAVGKDVVAAGGDIQIEGKVGRDILAAGGTVTINAPVAGHVEVYAQKVILGSKAVVNGTFTYHSPAPAQIDPAAKIVGHVEYLPTATPTHKDINAMLVGLFTLWFFLKMLMVLVVGLLLAWLMNRYTVGLVEAAYTRPVLGFFKGLAAIILFPIVSIVVCITVVGLPLGIIGILSYAALVIFSALIAPIIFGSLVYGWFMRKGAGYEVSWKSVLVGVVAYAILGLIPVVGWLVGFIFIPLAFGVILSAKWELIQSLR